MPSLSEVTKPTFQTFCLFIQPFVFKFQNYPTIAWLISYGFAIKLASVLPKTALELLAVYQFHLNSASALHHLHHCQGMGILQRDV